MTVDEIFKNLSAHMIKGVMIHEQMADYYDFLNLHGYKRCHEYHMYNELKSMRRMHRYYLNHYNKLIEESIIDSPDIIPTSWYRYDRQDVDVNTKRSAVRTGIEKWLSWEEETKALYGEMYRELMGVDEVATAKKIRKLICAVDKELKCAYRKSIELKDVDYSIGYILGEQQKLHDMYKRRMEWSA